MDCTVERIMHGYTDLRTTLIGFNVIIMLI
jgi:hypothetical protein